MGILAIGPRGKLPPVWVAVRVKVRVSFRVGGKQTGFVCDIIRPTKELPV